MFELKSVHYATKQGKILLNQISAHIPKGKLVAFLGANGAGKSTLLRCLFGHFAPTLGEVHFEASPILRLSAREKAQKIAWLSQDVASDLALTVEEFVLLGRRAAMGAFKAPSQKDWAAVRAALETMDLANLAARRFTFLSGGERQRAAIAQVLAQDTPTILLDEPTNHLDLRHRHLLLQYLKTLVAQGKSVIAVLHDLDLVARYADIALILRDGHLLAAGEVAAVLTDEHLSAAYDWAMRVRREEGRLRVEVA